MIIAGSKGSPINISQIAACVGQQNVEGFYFFFLSKTSFYFLSEKKKKKKKKEKEFPLLLRIEHSLTLLKEIKDLKVVVLLKILIFEDFNQL